MSNGLVMSLELVCLFVYVLEQVCNVVFESNEDGKRENERERERESEQESVCVCVCVGVRVCLAHFVFLTHTITRVRPGHAGYT